MLSLRDIAGKRGVSATCSSREVARLQRSPVNSFSVISYHLSVMGDHYLLCTPVVHLPGGIFPIRQSGKDLGLGGIGLEVADVFEIFGFLRPIMEFEGLVRLHMTEHALDVHGNVGTAGALEDYVGSDVPVAEAGQMIDVRLQIGDVDIVYGVGIDDREAP